MFDKIGEFLGIGKSIKDGAEGIGGLVETTVSSITGELKPDDKAKIEAMKLELETKLEELSLEGSKQFYDFMLGYEGKAEDVPKVIQILRSLPRPLFSIFFLVILFISFGIDYFNMIANKVYDFTLIKNLPNEFWWILGIVISFYFAGRASEKVVDKLLDKNNPGD